jgi:hypothetical protein
LERFSQRLYLSIKAYGLPSAFGKLQAQGFLKLFIVFRERNIRPVGQAHHIRGLRGAYFRRSYREFREDALVYLSRLPGSVQRCARFKLVAEALE